MRKCSDVFTLTIYAKDLQISKFPSHRRTTRKPLEMPLPKAQWVGDLDHLIPTDEMIRTAEPVDRKMEVEVAMTDMMPDKLHPQGTAISVAPFVEVEIGNATITDPEDRPRLLEVVVSVAAMTTDRVEETEGMKGTTTIIAEGVDLVHPLMAVATTGTAARVLEAAR